MSMDFNFHMLWVEEGGGVSVAPFDRYANICPIVWGYSRLNALLTPSLVNLGSLTLTPHTILISLENYPDGKGME